MNYQNLVSLLSASAFGFADNTDLGFDNSCSTSSNNCLVVVANMCVPCRKIHIVIVFVIKLLQFSNSFIDFLIYCLRMADYRKAISQIFFICKCRGRTNNREVYPLSDSRTNIALVHFSSALSLYYSIPTLAMINPADMIQL